MATLRTPAKPGSPIARAKKASDPWKSIAAGKKTAKGFRQIREGKASLNRSLTSGKYLQTTVNYRGMKIHLMAGPESPVVKAVAAGLKAKVAERRRASTPA